MANREILEVDITEPGMGYVATAPPAYFTREGTVALKAVWNHNDTGYYEHGTIVLAAAVPYAGYKFDHWSGEVPGGVNYNQGVNIAMTENRNIKCHFRAIDVEPPPPPPPNWVLLGSASVTVGPVPVEVDWVLLGSASVLVSPNPVEVDWVLLGSATIMIEPGGIIPPMICTIDDDCPPGYKCVAGFCVKEEEKGGISPWLLVAGGLGVAAIAVVAATKKKPAKEKKKS